MRADAGGVRSASTVAVDLSRRSSASRPSTRDVFSNSTSAASESMRLLSELMASSSSSFVADSRRRRRVQLCVAVLCSGRRLLGAKLWATASSAMHSVLCIVQTGFLTAVLAGLNEWRFGKAACSLAGRRYKSQRSSKRSDRAARDGTSTLTTKRAVTAH